MLKLKKYGKKILLTILVILLCISSAISITLLGKAKNNGVVFASEPEQQKAVIYKTTGLTASSTESLSTEVALSKGGAELEDGGVVYEGEYIKYNFRLTNKTQTNIDNVKIVASIPDGVKYGELNSNFEEFRQPYFYSFNEELKEKTIEVGTIEAGQSKEVFYEVKAKDLAEGETEKAIVANVNSYIGEELAQSYQLRNLINPADTQLFLGSCTQYGGKQYGLNIKSDIQEEVEVKIHFPKNFTLSFITYMIEEFNNVDKFEQIDNGGEVVHMEYRENTSQYTLEDLKNMIGEEKFNELQKLEELENIDDIEEFKGKRLKDLLDRINALPTLEGLTISDDNVLTAKLKANHCYKFFGAIDATKVENQSNNIAETVTAYAETVENSYMSNENRIEVPCQDVSVIIKSSKDGKKVKYDEDIDYEISIKNIGGSLQENNIEAPSFVHVDLLDFMPDEIIPESVTYNNWRLINKDDFNVSEKFYLEEIKDININVSGKREDDEGNEFASIELPLTIPQRETVVVKIKAKAGFVYKETKVENVVTVTSKEMQKDRVSNKISHTILPYNYENSSVPDVPDNPDIPDIPDVPDVPDNPDVPDDPNRPDTPNVPDRPNNDDKDQIKKEYCDFKVDKYVSKITVKTASGVKEYNYNNENLAKVEIKAKEINGAVVTVDYKIVVTNEGNVAGTISEISDKLPKGFAISEKSNKSWPRNSKGEFINKSKSNLRIEPGESTTLIISATKQMTADTVGTYINEATIKSASSITGAQDANSQNDTSNAQIIISISTGIYICIAIAIFVLIVFIIGAIYLSKKGKLKIIKINKTMVLSILFITMIVTRTYQVLAISFAVNDGSGAGEKEGVSFSAISTHEWSSALGNAFCEDGSVFSAPNGCEWRHWYTESDEYVYQTRTTDVFVGKTNTQIEMKSSDGSFIYGPFNYMAGGFYTSFKCSVYDHSGNQINASVSNNLSNRK